MNCFALFKDSVTNVCFKCHKHDLLHHVCDTGKKSLEQSFPYENALDHCTSFQCVQFSTFKQGQSARKPSYLFGLSLQKQAKQPVEIPTILSKL